MFLPCSMTKDIFINHSSIYTLHHQLTFKLVLNNLNSFLGILPHLPYDITVLQAAIVMVVTT